MDHVFEDDPSPRMPMPQILSTLTTIILTALGTAFFFMVVMGASRAEIEKDNKATATVEPSKPEKTNNLPAMLNRNNLTLCLYLDQLTFYRRVVRKMWTLAVQNLLVDSDELAYAELESRIGKKKLQKLIKERETESQYQDLTSIAQHITDVQCYDGSVAKCIREGNVGIGCHTGALSKCNIKVFASVCEDIVPATHQPSG